MWILGQLIIFHDVLITSRTGDADAGHEMERLPEISSRAWEFGTLGNCRDLHFGMWRGRKEDSI